MKTAIQKLLDYMGEYDIYPLETVKNQFLETEKKQIIDFANKCQLVHEVDCDENVIFSFRPEDLYTSIFKTNKETLK